MPITDSDLMAITIPSDADRRRSEATLGSSMMLELIGIRQCFCVFVYHSEGPVNSGLLKISLDKGRRFGYCRVDESVWRPAGA